MLPADTRRAAYDAIAQAGRALHAPAPSILATPICSPSYRPTDLDAFIRAMEGRTIAARPKLLARRSRGRDVPERVHRRRRLAASGPMPPELAEHFTTGQLAAMKIVADEVRSTGACRLTYREIGDRAGVSRETVKDAVQIAARHGLLRRDEQRMPGRRSAPNILTVASAAWRAWLENRPRRTIVGGVGVAIYPPQSEGKEQGAIGKAMAPVHRRDPPSPAAPGRAAA
jgi:hypothetical protein